MARLNRRGFVRQLLGLVALPFVFIVKAREADGEIHRVVSSVVGMPRDPYGWREASVRHYKSDFPGSTFLQTLWFPPGDGSCLLLFSDGSTDVLRGTGECFVETSSAAPIVYKWVR